LSRIKSRGSESRARHTSPPRTKSRGRDAARRQSPTPSSRSKKSRELRTSPPPRSRSDKKSRGEGRSKHSSPSPEKSKPRPSREKSKTKGDVIKRAAPPPQSAKRKPEPPAEPDPEPSVPDLDAFVLAVGDEAVNAAREELFNFDGIVSGVSAARENVAKFAAEHELEPSNLANKWLDFVEQYIMPPVRRAGMFSDDTTCVTGTTGWETCDTTVVVPTTTGTNPKLLDLVRDSTTTPAKAQTQKKTSLKPSMPMLKKGPKGFLKSMSDFAGKEGPKIKGKSKKPFMPELDSIEEPSKSSRKGQKDAKPRKSRKEMIDDEDELKSTLSIETFEL